MLNFDLAQTADKSHCPPVWCNRRWWSALALGFYSGLPLLLTGSVLQARLKDAGVDLVTLGALALLGLPYTLKFIWAPALDRYALSRLGRRRSWLLFSQVMTAVCLLGLARTEPNALALILMLAFLTALFSATQDIAVDAYRREILADHEQGLGGALYVNGYRFALLLASGGGLMLADWLGFNLVYTSAAALMLTGALFSLLWPEPAALETPRSLRDAVWLPLRHYFERPSAGLLLTFILLYKIGDAVAGQMTLPFYQTVGFSKTEIGAVVKLFGFWATLLGALLGGALLLRVSLYSALRGFGVLQALSTAAFVALTYSGPSLPVLAAVVSFENLSSGMGTAAFTALLAMQTDRRYSATQYALLSSVMGIPRVFIAAPSGWLAQHWGWWWFFIVCAALALPGVALVGRLQRTLRAPI